MVALLIKSLVTTLTRQTLRLLMDCDKLRSVMLHFPLTFRPRHILRRHPAFVGLRHIFAELPEGLVLLALHISFPRSHSDEERTQSLALLRWDELGSYLRLLPELRMVACRLEVGGSTTRPEWTADRVAIVDQGMHSFLGHREGVCTIIQSVRA